MHGLSQDIRHGIRSLLKRPGFTVVALVALALGIGANTTIFSAINALLLHPFAFRDIDQLVLISESRPQVQGEHNAVAFANYLDVKSQAASFASVAASTNWWANITDGDQPERLEGVNVSAQYFSTLGVNPAAGRTFSPEEEQPGRDPVVIISDGLWHRRFGGDLHVVGRNTTINGRSFTIIGVMPRGFAFPNSDVEVWAPLITFPENVTNRGSTYLTLIGRLKPKVSVAEAERELELLGRRLAEQYPETNANRTFLVESLLGSYVRFSRPSLLIMFGAVLFVLLIACANVANLQMMRATRRQKEMAVRLALGANRWRLARQLLTESVLLAIAGGAVGLLLSAWAVKALASGMPANLVKYISGWKNLGIDWQVFSFTLCVSVLTGIGSGLAPALLLTKANLNEELKEGASTSSEGGRSRLRNLLVIAEVALSLVLLVGSGLMIRSFMRVLAVKPGFDAGSVLTFELSLPYRKYASIEQRAGFFAKLLPRLETIPGVSRTGATNLVPLENGDESVYFSIEGQPLFAPGQAPLADYRVITPGYLSAMGIPLLKGRTFNERDIAGARPVAIISEKLAAHYFPNEDPLGRRVRVGDGPCEIVGIVGDVRNKSFSSEVRDERLRPAIYLPHAQHPYGQMAVVVRSTTDPTSLASAARKEVEAIEKDQPLFNVRTMSQVRSESMVPQRLSAFMFASFALIALLLAAIGIYAVIAYSVVQRTREIGIRMALGAQSRDVLKLVVRGGMKLAVIGVAIGLAGALVLGRLMRSLLYGVTPTDAATFAGVSAGLIVISLLACYIPARRAAKVDPLVALRYE
ncbi:MAG TPA: ABC transporter permease [Pyrinomonadaceae bacterium]|nr:ABC transporter permease [Pyrinomonadaceae bacterium]